MDNLRVAILHALEKGAQVVILSLVVFEVRSYEKDFCSRVVELTVEMILFRSS